MIPGWEPVTGPVFIKGAYPFDFVAIDMPGIRLSDIGATSYVPRFETLSSTDHQVGEDLEPNTTTCEIEGDHIDLTTTRGDIAIPVSALGSG